MMFKGPIRYGNPSIIYPGESIDIEAEFAGAPDAPGKMRPLTPELKQELLDFKRYLAVYGQATYHDLLGEHWIRFCAWSTLGSPPIEHGVFNSGACPAYNSAGDGPLPN